VTIPVWANIPENPLQRTS